ncbi:MAG: glycoside hydrolase family 13 protein [Bacteroidota bacterium]|nr:glycoside hydrolase family 13 protein [Bacteroidota bacterium]
MAHLTETIPAWVKDAVFYQIFPERFANGDPTTNPENVEDWGKPPRGNNYFGGDLQGIIDHLNYIKELGINTLYLNPIFSADSNHKYNTKNYRTIDPSFGTNELFDQFIKKCHEQNIRVVIDGVFNHVGTAFFAFQDVLKNGKDSKYASWFNIFSFPIAMKPKPNYECWWGHSALPKLMVQNPEVKNYIFEVTEHWTKKGIDGWRLDVPNELPHEFWKEWRTVVRSINKDCYIVGELWEDASPWLLGNEFDATMNYRFRSSCLKFFAEGKISAKEFDKELETTRNLYPRDVNFAMQNLLGSHDTERYLTMCDNDVEKMKLSYLFQMTYVGAPMIYYGDEIGMEGGKDPDCRRTMIWDKKKWNTNLRNFIKKLIAIRTSSSALRQGTFVTLIDESKSRIFAFERQSDNNFAYVLINRSNRKLLAKIPIAKGFKKLKDELSGEQFTVKKETLSLNIPAHSGRIFIATLEDKL